MVKINNNHIIFIRDSVFEILTIVETIIILVSYSLYP